MIWPLVVIGVVGLLADASLLVFVIKELVWAWRRPRDWDLVGAWSVVIIVQALLACACLATIVGASRSGS